MILSVAFNTFILLKFLPFVFHTVTKVKANQNKNKFLQFHLNKL